jgi:hypothetical protein
MGGASHLPSRDPWVHQGWSLVKPTSPLPLSFPPPPGEQQGKMGTWRAGQAHLSTNPEHTLLVLWNTGSQAVSDRDASVPPHPTGVNGTLVAGEKEGGRQ